MIITLVGECEGQAVLAVFTFEVLRELCVQDTASDSTDSCLFFSAAGYCCTVLHVVIVRQVVMQQI